MSGMEYESGWGKEKEEKPKTQEEQTEEWEEYLRGQAREAELKGGGKENDDQVEAEEMAREHGTRVGPGPNSASASASASAPGPAPASQQTTDLNEWDRFAETTETSSDTTNYIETGQTRRGALRENIEEQLRETDNDQVPPFVAATLKLTYPRAVKTWASLRAWILENQGSMLSASAKFPERLRELHVAYLSDRLSKLDHTLADTNQGAVLRVTVHGQAYPSDTNSHTQGSGTIVRVDPNVRLPQRAVDTLSWGSNEGSSHPGDPGEPGRGTSSRSVITGPPALQDITAGQRQLWRGGGNGRSQRRGGHRAGFTSPATRNDPAALASLARSGFAADVEAHRPSGQTRGFWVPQLTPLYGSSIHHPSPLGLEARDNPEPTTASAASARLPESASTAPVNTSLGPVRPMCEQPPHSTTQTPLTLSNNSQPLASCASTVSPPPLSHGRSRIEEDEKQKDQKEEKTRVKEDEDEDEKKKKRDEDDARVSKIHAGVKW